MERIPCRSPSQYLTAATRRCSPKIDSIWRAPVVPEEGCRTASAGQALVLSRTRVRRGLSVLETDAVGELHAVEIEAQIALARCRRCERRVRVLPCDVLPYKHYSVSVIAQLAGAYTGGWQDSLRVVCCGIWDPHPIVIGTGNLRKVLGI